MFITNPTTSIRARETSLTPPKASPFTPVAIGLMKAQVLERVTMINAWIAENSIVAERGSTIRNMLICTAVLLRISVEKELSRAINRNIASTGRCPGSS